MFNSGKDIIKSVLKEPTVYLKCPLCFEKVSKLVNGICWECNEIERKKDKASSLLKQFEGYRF